MEGGELKNLGSTWPPPPPQTGYASLLPSFQDTNGEMEETVVVSFKKHGRKWSELVWKSQERGRDSSRRKGPSLKNARREPFKIFERIRRRGGKGRPSLQKKRWVEANPRVRERVSSLICIGEKIRDGRGWLYAWPTIIVFHVWWMHFRPFLCQSLGMEIGGYPRVNEGEERKDIITEIDMR